MKSFELLLATYPDLDADIIGALHRYVHHKIPTGGFLEAVLANDLIGAVNHADHINLHRLRPICSYIYNEMPSDCFGSYVMVSDWLNKGN